MEDLTFSEWSDFLGGNRWLSVYGLRQSSDEDDDEVDGDGDYDGFASEGGIVAQSHSQFVFLETIVEETSDDLRSESDAASAAHAPGSLDGSERDLSLPKKRLRREEDSLSSRSSSLLQFECLERHCEAADAPTRIRSYRSFDSLHLLGATKLALRGGADAHVAEEPEPDEDEDDDDDDEEGAAPSVAAEGKVRRSAENLSEDSGYGEAAAPAANTPPPGLKLGDDPERGWAEAKFSGSCWRSAPSLAEVGEGDGSVCDEAAMASGRGVRFCPVVAEVCEPVQPDKKPGRLGAFFGRFSFRRFGGAKKGKKKSHAATQPAPAPSTAADYEDVRIIPLHPPEETTPMASKPPLPPARAPPQARRRGADASSMASGERAARPGLLETDLDAAAASTTTASNAGKKTRSLLDLGGDARAKSMEFLLDKGNQAAVQPPENELQKSGAERTMSEHQLRVQRSLQRLHVPDWYKNSSVATRPEGFLLKRGSDSGTHHWPGLGSKTTSLSSLGSSQSAAPRSPTTNLLSPSPTPNVFMRWSTSRLNSGGTSTSTSPCGSTRSSFNYRQPYLGWRSQERLSRPRTPAERLAAGLLPAQRCEEKDIIPDDQIPQVPNLSEVRTSIKEVTSAIVHYVSGVKESTSSWDTDTRSSPRGSGRLCWLESSFVGSRPLDSPETPLPLSSGTTLEGSKVGVPGDLYLELGNPQPQNYNAHQVNGPPRSRPSPGSTTLEDVLDSLLGLPPASRSPSPGPGDLRSELPGSASDGDKQGGPAPRRRSEGSDPGPRTRPPPPPRARRVSFDTAAACEEPAVRCRYSKCGKTAPAAEARRTFKTCHNCSHAYCSRECRRAHWERHRRTCLHSRAGALCRQVLAAARDDPATLRHLSLLARRGYLAQGRGALKLFFSAPETAERFVSGGLARLGEPAFVRWADLLPGEMGPDLYAELLRLCKGYNPDTRLVLYVAVCVVGEAPASGAVKWERQLVSRCAKLRLCRSLTPAPVAALAAASAPAASSAAAPARPRDITRDMEDPETLILTSLPGCRGRVSPRRAREISFTNIQRQLRQRGVSLRRHFPDVYRRLLAYVDGSAERFTPVTVYPHDALTGKSFMCIIMPDAEPERLQLVPRDSARVRTVDVGVEPSA